MILAIIDLGSNSIRMDVVAIDEDGAYAYLVRQRRMVRLSEGADISGSLQSTSIDRAIAALSEFKEIIEKFKADEVIAVATAAVRNAENRDEFVRRVRDETGINIRVIRGEQEAEYDFLGVVGSVKVDDCVIVDTGGGSTEIILVSGGEALAQVSIPVGAVNMTDRFLSGGEDAASLAALKDYVSSSLDKVAWLDDAIGVPVVGIGGSIRNLAVVESGNPNINRAELNGYSIAAASAEETYDRIVEMTELERADVGIESARTDTIAAGILPTIELLKKLESDELIISTAGLKEGVLAEFVENVVR